MGQKRHGGGNSFDVWHERAMKAKWRLIHRQLEALNIRCCVAVGAGKQNQRLPVIDVRARGDCKITARYHARREGRWGLAAAEQIADDPNTDAVGAF